MVVDFCMHGRMWLQGDATEDEEHRLMAKKEGLLSSKLLRGLFGGNG